MTRKEFILSFAQDHGMSIVDSKSWCDAVLDHLYKMILVNDRVDLYGFGKFFHMKWRGHVAYNMRTNEKIQLPDSVVVKFAPSQKMKQDLELTTGGQ